MRKTIIVLSLLILILVTWSCVHINISDGDIDDSINVTGIEKAEDEDANNED